MASKKVGKRLDKEPSEFLMPKGFFPDDADLVVETIDEKLVIRMPVEEVLATAGMYPSHLPTGPPGKALDDDNILLNLGRFLPLQAAIE